MATLNIGGQRVTVDDSFMSLSPDDQNRTVSEIEAQLSAAKPSESLPDGRATRASREAMPTRDEMKGAYREMASGVRERQGTVAKYADTAIRGLARAVPFMDDIAAAGDYYLSGKGASYDDALDRQRAMNQTDDADRPVTSYGAQIIGGAALPASALKPGAGFLANAATGAKVGGVYGALHGAGSGEGLGDRVEKALGGGLLGSLLGGAIGGVAGKLLPSTAPVAAKEGAEIADAAGRIGVPVSAAIASDSMAVQRIGQGLRNIPVVGDAIPKATQATTEGLREAVGNAANQMGSGSGPNIANRVGNLLDQLATQETGAATKAAAAADEATMAAFDAAKASALGKVSAAEQKARAKADSAVGSISPQDLGAALISRLKAGEEAAVNAKNKLYGLIKPGMASVDVGFARKASSRVVQALEDAGQVVDRELTPAAAKMLDELARFSEGKLPNLAVGARLASDGTEKIAGIDITGIEFIRRRLNSFAGAASNDADRSAAVMIRKQFDKWVDDAFDKALYSGSDEALNTVKAARQANTDWRSRFGYNARDDADKLINKIVTGEVTPQEVANWVIGSTKIGAQGVSSRLLTRIQEATNGDPAALASIQGGVWNKLSRATEGVEGKTPEAIANGIHEFLNGSGKAVANKLYPAEQRDVMRLYADTLRRGQSAREGVEAAAKSGRPQPTEVGVGPLQEMANTVLGRGGKTDESLYSAIDAYAKSGARGDINTLAGILRVMPEAEKGNLAGSIVRGLGISPKTGQWSPDVFLSQWRSYTPQAKALLFGSTGNHVQAIEDIALVAQRLQDVGKRFGNPSGSAQNLSGAGAVTAIMAEPLTAVATLIGGTVASKILASPATASSMAKWSRAYENAVMKPSAATASTLQIAARNFSATASEQLGVNGLMKQLQGTIHVRADGKEQQPERQ